MDLRGIAPPEPPRDQGPFAELGSGTYAAEFALEAPAHLEGFGLILVQHIRVVWTKASRGAPRANQRSAVPWALSLALTTRAPLVIHRASFLEATDFARRDEHQTTRETLEHAQDGLLIEHVADGLRVGFRWDMSFGIPRRFEKANAFTLSEDEYGRVIVNGRHSSHDHSWYTQDTFNVAFGSVPNGEVFIESEPTAVLDLRRRLL